MSRVKGEENSKNPGEIFRVKNLTKSIKTVNIKTKISNDAVIEPPTVSIIPYPEQPEVNLPDSEERNKISTPTPNEKVKTDPYFLELKSSNEGRRKWYKHTKGNSMKSSLTGRPRSATVSN